MLRQTEAGEAHGEQQTDLRRSDVPSRTRWWSLRGIVDRCRMSGYTAAVLLWLTRSAIRSLSGCFVRLNINVVRPASNEGVFNLTAVMWDAECNDWCIGDNGKTACPGENPGETQKSVRKAIQKALKMPKSDGVILLEHELNKYTVGFFEEYYPKLQSLGWKPTSIPEQLGVDWYHNAANNDDTPVKVNSMVYSDVADAMSKSNGASSNKAAVKNSSSSSSGSPSSSTSMNANATKGTSGAAKVTIASAGVAALAGTLACLLALV